MEQRDMEIELDLREYLNIIIKRIYLILLITIVAIAASGVVSYFVLEPIYQSSTTVMVGKPIGYTDASNIQMQDLNLNQRLARTYGEIVKSRTVSQDVIEQLNLGISPEQLAKKTSVNLVKDTEFITISVTDTEPEKAAIIANKLAEVFRTHVMRIMNVDNVQVLDRAEVPKNSIKPRPMLNIAIAGVLGLMVGLFIAFLIEFLDNTIKTPDDIQKHLGLNVIGTIPIMSNED